MMHDSWTKHAKNKNYAKTKQDPETKKDAKTKHDPGTKDDAKSKQDPETKNDSKTMPDAGTKHDAKKRKEGLYNVCNIPLFDPDMQSLKNLNKVNDAIMYVCFKVFKFIVIEEFNHNCISADSKRLPFSVRISCEILQQLGEWRIPSH